MVNMLLAPEAILSVGTLYFIASVAGFPIWNRLSSTTKVPLPVSKEAKSSASLPSIEFHGLHHMAILVKDLEKAKFFYGTVLGCQSLSALRESLAVPFPGAFYTIGKNQIHLMAIDHSAEFHTITNRTRPLLDYVGRDSHTAISVHSIDSVRHRLDAHQIPYKLSQSGRRAIFFRDYDGHGLEFTEDTYGYI